MPIANCSHYCDQLLSMKKSSWSICLQRNWVVRSCLRQTAECFWTIFWRIYFLFIFKWLMFVDVHLFWLSQYFDWFVYLDGFSVFSLLCLLGFSVFSLVIGCKSSGFPHSLQVSFMKSLFSWAAYFAECSYLLFILWTIFPFTAQFGLFVCSFPSCRDIFSSFIPWSGFSNYWRHDF